VQGAEEEPRFKELFDAHHYLGIVAKIGHTIWYVRLSLIGNNTRFLILTRCALFGISPRVCSRCSSGGSARDGRPDLGARCARDDGRILYCTGPSDHRRRRCAARSTWLPSDCYLGFGPQPTGPLSASPSFLQRSLRDARLYPFSARHRPRGPALQRLNAQIYDGLAIN
jgi:hypothetical protein